MCVAGIGALSLQIRCVDAAREAARLAARGDPAAVQVSARIAPTGAGITIRRDGELVIATVTAGSAVPGLALHAEAVSLAEPGG